MTAGTPKYSLIIDQVLRDIQAGTYEIGEILPTESDLMRAYGVSRHTVRIALQRLRSRGVIASRQGQGSKVISDGRAAGLVEKIQSVDELIAIGQETKRTLISASVIEADDELSAAFQSAAGRHLLEVHMLRHLVGKPEKPIAYVILWMDALFEPIVEDLERQQRAVAELLDIRFRRSIGYVHQVVSAGALDATAANYLKRPKGEPVLTIERSYAVSPGIPIHLLAKTICAPDAVKVESVFQHITEAD